MTQHAETDPAELRSVAADVPLSERPLVADGENTVISSPDKNRAETPQEIGPIGETLRQRLFPSGGTANGDEAGVRIAHYEIRERLGSGGMGAVFRATDLELARDIALKILQPGSSEDSSLVARFRNEARACAQLNHDNIARVYFAGAQDGLYFIAYELAEGTTIKDLIHDRGQITPEETVNYAIQVTLALNHITAAGIVHRDIKPSNIMLTPNGRVKVVDLGLARRDITDSIGDITVAGTTLGTFDYIAPEQARDPRCADIRSDIYSLGCTMYHMLTGQPPYPEGTALQKLLDHQGKSPPDPRSINKQIGVELAAVMKKMMASNPELRYQAPALLLSDLLHLAQMMGLQSIPAEGIVWRKAGPITHRRPMGAIWVFASVMVICLTAIVLERFPVVSSNGNNSALITDNLSDAVPVDDFASNTGDQSTNADIAAPDTPTSDQTQSPSTGSPAAIKVPADAIQAIALNSMHLTPSSSALEYITGIGRDRSFQMASEAVSPVLSTVASAELSGVFELQKADGTTQPFQTLRGAVADAKSGDVILLKYNGYPPEIVSQPAVRISMINLIIRAADGYRPTLEFDGGGTGAVSRTEMFTLRNGGTLTIRDIDLRMIMRDSVATDRWSMFRIDGPNRIHLENVTLDCRNPSRLAGSVFDLIDPASVTEETSNVESSITLNRVFCRGEVDGFRIAGQPQGRMRLQSSAFALSGSLIQNIGSSSMLQIRGKLDITLEHISTILAAPLMVMQDSDEADGRGPQRILPNLTITSDACVFASASADSPMIFSNGNAYLEDIQSSLAWTGFTNLYSGYETLWQIDTADMDFNDSRRIDMAQWKQLWQNRNDGEESNGNIVESANSLWRDPSWANDAVFQPSTVNPYSFQLDPSMFAVNAGRFPFAPDGRQPGIAATDLPSFPGTGTVKNPVLDPASTTPMARTLPLPIDVTEDLGNAANSTSNALTTGDNLNSRSANGVVPIKGTEPPLANPGNRANQIGTSNAPPNP